MTAQRQRVLLVLALLVTLALVWFAPEDTTPQVAQSGGKSAKARAPAPATVARAQAAGAPRGAASSAVRPPLTLRERVPADEILNVFVASSWYRPPPPPPPTPPVAPPPPPAPVTPPLPFTYMGQLIEDGKPVYILARADRVVTVQPGDNIDKTYRLDSASGGVLTFVYVPLGTKQTLATGVSP